MTYIVIALLIVLLAGVAYYLRSSKTITATTTNQVLTYDPLNANNGTTTTKGNTVKANVGNGILVAVATTTMNSTSTKPMSVHGATLHTNMGDIEIAFDDKNAPNTVINFVTLASTKFYDGVRFHRVIKDFMIQTGDPLSKDLSKKDVWGTGGPGYKFADELKGNEKYTQGTVAMANAGPNTNGSQFFIVTASPSVGLPPSYTVFGHVTKGIDIALKIQNVKTELPGQADRPVEEVVVKSVTLK